MPSKPATGRETYPAQDIEIITPDDDEVIDPTREVEIAVSGTLRVRMAGSQRDVTIPAAIVTDNWRKVMSVDKIFATGTTATGILVSR
jgi:hypothetical protein